MYYNEMLFSRGFRRYVHLARFNWLKKQCDNFRVSYQNVVELGCFDGRAIGYLPSRPAHYHGFDSGAEGGIYIAREKYKDYEFTISNSPNDLLLVDNASLVFSLETLEHISPVDLEDYFRTISKIMGVGSIFIMSVPNEIGLIFLLKYISKMIYYGGEHKYTLTEIVAEMVGRTEYVAQNGHKGFHWGKMIKQLQRHFEVLKIEGVQIKRFPPSLNITIGIVVRAIGQEIAH
jgi:hypothetical protein